MSLSHLQPNYSYKNSASDIDNIVNSEFVIRKKYFLYNMLLTFLKLPKKKNPSLPIDGYSNLNQF